MGFIFDSEGNAYFTHPTYIRYASDHYGNVVDIKKKVFIDKDEFGYIYIEDYHRINKKYNSDKTRTVKYRSDNFVWECFNDIKPKNGLIEHVDGDKLNNKLSNLRLVKYFVNCCRKW